MACSEGELRKILRFSFLRHFYAIFLEGAMLQTYSRPLISMY